MRKTTSSARRVTRTPRPGAGGRRGRCRPSRRRRDRDSIVVHRLPRAARYTFVCISCGTRLDKTPRPRIAQRHLCDGPRNAARPGPRLNSTTLERRQTTPSHTVCRRDGPWTARDGETSKTAAPTAAPSCHADSRRRPRGGGTLRFPWGLPVRSRPVAGTTRTRGTTYTRRDAAGSRPLPDRPETTRRGRDATAARSARGTSSSAEFSRRVEGVCVCGGGRKSDQKHDIDNNTVYSVRVDT